MKHWNLIRWIVAVLMLLALPILLAVVTIAIVRIPRGKLRWWVPVYGYGSVLINCGIIAAMEFTMDEKIEILQWMRIDLIFIVMAQVAFLMILSTCRVIHESDSGGRIPPPRRKNKHRAVPDETALTLSWFIISAAGIRSRRPAA